MPGWVVTLLTSLIYKLVTSLIGKLLPMPKSVQEAADSHMVAEQTLKHAIKNHIQGEK